MRLPSTPVEPLRAIASEVTLAGAGRARGSRRLLAPAISIVAAGVFGVVIASHSHEFIDALDRAVHASWQLVLVGAALEAASLMGYVLLLHRVIARDDPELRFKHSYDITLAGSTITRLLPTAGLGGAAVTVWALRARGMRPRELTERLLAFMLLLYAVYMAALLSCGTALAVGLVHVSRGQALGLVAVAVTSAIVTVVLILPSLGAGAIRRIAGRPGNMGVAADRVAQHLPALRAALQRSWREVRRPTPALLGALAWWGFDIGVLAAMLHAFGVGMQIPVIVLAYFLGTMFNVMPLPGSLSGGLVAVLIALGAPAAPALAAVLAYRTIAVWLPAASGVASLTSLRSSVAGWRAAPADAT